MTQLVKFVGADQNLRRGGATFEALPTVAKVGIGAPMPYLQSDPCHRWTYGSVRSSRSQP
jgi:hypothetical protein